MKIVFVSPEYVTEKIKDGGLASYLHKIASILVADGHSVSIIVPSEKNESFIHDNIIIHRVKLSRYAVNFLKAINRLTGFKIKYFNYWLYQSFLLNKFLQSKFSLDNCDVVQFASYTATSYFNHGTLPSLVRISGYQPLWEVAYGMSEHHPYVEQIAKIEDTAFRNAEKIIGPSKLIGDVVTKAVGIKAQIVRSPIGFIDQKNVSVSLCEFSKKFGRYILFFGSLGRLKGVDILVESLKSILQKYPDLNVVFAGKDMKFETSSMSQYVSLQLYNHADRIHLLGSVSKADLWKLVTKSEAVVLPSRIDNYPNACVEAMQLGAIVIGSNGASFEEIIKDEENGFLFFNGDADSLEKTIVKVLGLLPEQRLRITHMAKTTFDSISYNRMVLDQHLLAYGEVINDFAKIS